MADSHRAPAPPDGYEDQLAAGLDLFDQLRAAASPAELAGVGEFIYLYATYKWGDQACEGEQGGHRHRALVYLLCLRSSIKFIHSILLCSCSSRMARRQTSFHGVVCR